MTIRKLDATTSTNTELKAAWAKNDLNHPTVLWADYQSNGRGQYQRHWESKAGENLTFSVFWPHKQNSVPYLFHINQLTCVALTEALNHLGLPSVSIKWPNDILSGTLKLAGVLIENIFMGKQLKASIIGIGLNVNQTDFYHLPKATSIALVLGKKVVREKLLHQFLRVLECHLKTLGMPIFEKHFNTYQTELYGRGQWMAFSDQGVEKKGKVLGVTTQGGIKIQWESGSITVIEDSKYLEWLPNS